MKARTLRDNSLALVQMASARPVTNNDAAALIGCPRSQAGARLNNLTRLGWLEPAGHNTHGLKQWRATNKGRTYAVGLPAPVIVRATPDLRPSTEAPVTYTAHTKRTVASGWTHDTRYQLPPGERIVGGFATLGIGRYLD